MNALARVFAAIFDPPLEELPPDEQWKLEVAKPFLERMDHFGRGWHSEDHVCGGNPGMSIIGSRCFWAKELGYIEYRRRFGRPGWWIRLTPLGLRYVKGLD